MKRLLAITAGLIGVWLLIRRRIMQVSAIANNLVAYEEAGIWYYEASQDCAASVEDAWRGWGRFLETMDDGSIPTLTGPLHIIQDGERPLLSVGTQVHVNGTFFGFNAGSMILRIDEANYGENVRMEVIPFGRSALKFAVVEVRINPAESSGTRLSYRQGYYPSPMGYAGKYLTFVREMEETAAILDRWVTLSQAATTRRFPIGEK